MPLEFFESDGNTPLSTIDLGTLKPGEDYVTKVGAPVQVVLKNTSAHSYTGVEVTLGAVAQFPSIEYARFALGATPPANPNGWSDHLAGPLVAGTLAQNATVNVWISAVVPLAAEAGRAQLLRLVAEGTREAP